MISGGHALARSFSFSLFFSFPLSSRVLFFRLLPLLLPNRGKSFAAMDRLLRLRYQVLCCSFDHLFR